MWHRERIFVCPFLVAVKKCMKVYAHILEYTPWTVGMDLSRHTETWKGTGRLDGAVTFYRNWTEYVNGFGDARSEYWMGLKHIQLMMSAHPDAKLRVDLEDWDGLAYHAEYSHFAVEDSSTNYRMTVLGYSGTAGDQLSYHSGQMFTTYDRDNDNYRMKNCAVVFKGGWWYNSCHNVNINSLYYPGGVINWKGIVWDDAKEGVDQHYSFKFTEMKLKF